MNLLRSRPFIASFLLLLFLGGTGIVLTRSTTLTNFLAKSGRGKKNKANNTAPASGESAKNKKKKQVKTSIDVVGYPQPPRAGSDVTFTAKIDPPEASGMVTFTIRGEKKTVAIENGSASWTISNMKAGPCPVSVTYNGWGKFSPSTQEKPNGMIEKGGTPIELSVSPSNLKTGDSATVSATLAKGATGTVSFTVNGKTVASKIASGKASVAFTVPKTIGSLAVKAEYSGDGDFSGVSTSKEWNVTRGVKEDSSIALEWTPADPAVSDPTVSLKAIVTPSDAKGIVTFSFSGQDVSSAPVKNGVASLNVSEFVAATYVVRASYGGDDNYTKSSVTKNMVVTKQREIETIIALDWTPTNPMEKETIVTFRASVSPPRATGFVSLNINGADMQSLPVTNGSASFKVGEFSPGTQTIIATFKGDEPYKNDSVTETMEVRVNPKAPKNNCCLCYYYDDEGDKCRSKSTIDCFADGDCSWSGTSCVDRHEKFCDNWFGMEASCDTKKKVPFLFMKGGLPTETSQLPTDFLGQCTDFKEKIMSHSDSGQCRNIAMHAKACIRCLGSQCSKMSIQHTGCETFEDIQNADQWMEFIRGNLAPNQTLEVSANQALASGGGTHPGTCSSMYRFNMTIKDKNMTVDPCRIGEHCFPKDAPKPEKAVWCADDGKAIHEICCRSPENVKTSKGYEIGKWQKGLTCR